MIKVDQGSRRTGKEFIIRSIFGVHKADSTNGQHENAPWCWVAVLAINSMYVKLIFLAFTEGTPHPAGVVG